ncbi:MAG: helix-turn-helix domain-containing protein [Chitinophagaceae bacterium]|nr:MAG: helix-turn-helix domain-containing protein [Chitinophagaceae bacterium]
MKKRQLTATEQAECAALKKIYMAKRKELGLTQEKLAESFGMSQTGVSMYLNGHNALNVMSAARFSSLLNEPVSTFSPRIADLIERLSKITVTTDAVAEDRSTEMVLPPIKVWDESTPLEDDEVYVPFLEEIELDAGHGKFAIEESNERLLRFAKRDLRNNGVQFSMAKCVTVRGRSMLPVLKDGATVGVNTGRASLSDVVDGDLYAINHNGHLRIKQLYRLPTGVRFRSFNRDEYPDEDYTYRDITEQDIRLIGHVFWWSMFSK